MHTTLASRAGLPAGYGLANWPLGLQGKALFRGHSGGMFGFISAFGYNRALGVGYAFSNNGGQRAPKLEQLVQAYLLRQLPAPAPLPPVPLDAAAVAPYLGHYRSEALRDELTGIADYLAGSANLRRQGNLVLLEPLIGPADTLLPTGPLTFRHPHEQTATTVLTLDKEGRRVLVTALPIGKAAYALAAGFWWWLPPALLAVAILLIGTSSLAALVSFVRVLRCQLPLVFVAFTVAGVVLTVRYFQQFQRPAVAWYLLLTYGALGWLAAVLGAYGWLNLRLWAV